MSDTQWPRFEVFVQDREGRPHRNVGTVHAPDSEFALLNARDVFVRRPACISLWVVPATAIYALTEQEIGDVSNWSAGDPERLLTESDQAEESYLVFQKRNQRRSMTYVEHVGMVTASNPRQAMAVAIATYLDEVSTVWWVFPERSVIRSEHDDIEAMFAPADDKAYRMPQHYRVLQEMLEVKTRLLGKADIEQDV
jgi:ring-1,2-phenylacetyl-CoA epoxidase subunit PaaB